MATKKMERVSTMIPAQDKKALEKSAEENGRSIMSEVRLAVQAWLKLNGRRA